MHGVKCKVHGLCEPTYIFQIVTCITSLHEINIIVCDVFQYECIVEGLVYDTTGVILHQQAAVCNVTLFNSTMIYPTQSVNNFL